MLALACAAVLTLIAAVHLYWGLGGRRGLAIAIPQTEQGRAVFTPSPGSAHAVGLALLTAVAFILAHGGYLVWPLWPAATRAVVGLLALVFLVRALGWFRYAGLFKAVRHTPFGRYDTWVYSPLCLLLGLALAHQVLA